MSELMSSKGNDISLSSFWFSECISCHCFSPSNIQWFPFSFFLFLCSYFNIHPFIPLDVISKTSNSTTNEKIKLNHFIERSPHNDLSHHVLMIWCGQMLWFIKIIWIKYHLISSVSLFSFPCICCGR